MAAYGCMSLQGSLLGTKGIATRSKDAWGVDLVWLFSQDLRCTVLVFRIGGCVEVRGLLGVELPELDRMMD